MIDAKRFVCKECNHRGRNEEILEAPSPFDPEEVIYGCPRCKGVDCMDVACDEAGCWRLVSWGQPTKDGGYRQTCHEHGVIVERAEKSIAP